jgi:signal transduction histidine kinase
MKFSLKSQLSLAIALVVLLTVSLISFLSNYLIQDQFKNYIATQQQKAATHIVESIGIQYDPATDAWDASFVHTIGMNALYDGYLVRVEDRGGKTVWDAETCDMTLCTRIMDEISHRMMMEHPVLNGEFTTKTYPVMQDAEEVGTVSISYYGPYFLSKEDFLFLDALNKILIGIGFFSLLISMITGVFLARRISGPIMITVQVTRDIADGKYNTRISESAGTKEMDQMINSINHMAEALEKQETFRKQLTADVAHELRTPLTTVQTHIEAMVEGVWEPTPERLESCYDELSRLGGLVSDLEDLAKVESDNLRLVKVELSLKEVSEKVLASFEKELKNKNITAGISGDCSPVSADRDRISQVIINLTSNAVKYTGSGGRIEVTLSDAEDSVVFSISDNGAGIPEEEIPYIFERFYRADKSRNRNTGGTGIGLAIVRSIVGAHGGKLDVVSKPGEGSTFLFTLPRE